MSLSINKFPDIKRQKLFERVAFFGIYPYDDYRRSLHVINIQGNQ